MEYTQISENDITFIYEPYLLSQLPLKTVFAVPYLQNCRLSFDMAAKLVQSEGIFQLKLKATRFIKIKYLSVHRIVSSGGEDEVLIRRGFLQDKAGI